MVRLSGRGAALTGMGLSLMAAVGFYGYASVSEKHPTPVYGAVPSPSAPMALPSMPAPPPALKASDFQAGVALYVGGVDQGPSLATRSRAFFDSISRLGINSVSVIFPIYTDSVWSSTVYADQRTPTHESLTTVIREAQRHGLFVVLRPLLDETLLKSQGLWRGQLSPSDVGAWFQSYSNLIADYAGLARQDGVDALDVGSEFESLQRYAPAWEAVIARARSIYSGQVTYSLNWTDLAFRIPFARSLDYLSVDAYFPLDAPVGASVSQLETAWQPWIAALNDLKSRVGHPIVLSEIGIASQLGAHSQPWILNPAGTLSLQEQSRYYRAACQSVADQMAGMYWWLFDLNSPQASGTDISFDPANKPAAREIASCFSAPSKGGRQTD